MKYIFRLERQTLYYTYYSYMFRLGVIDEVGLSKHLRIEDTHKHSFCMKTLPRIQLTNGLISFFSCCILYAMVGTNIGFIGLQADFSIHGILFQFIGVTHKSRCTVHGYLCLASDTMENNILPSRYRAGKCVEHDNLIILKETHGQSFFGHAVLIFWFTYLCSAVTQKNQPTTG